MEQKLRRWQLGGFLFTCASGTFLNFLYERCGKHPLVGILSATNESVWEHMKLLFVPMFLVTLAEMSRFSSRYRNFWRVKLSGTVLGVLLIPILHYTYTGAFGVRLSWLDISIFYLAAAAAYWIETRLLLREHPHSGIFELTAMVLLWLFALMFVFFTYAPPNFPIFHDPTHF